MGAEQIFILACLAQVSGLCWIMERKEKRIQASIKKAEKRRKEHLHDYYCTQEAERLYNKFKRSEGGLDNEQISA
ncbi:MAG: hypothetical protein MR278_01685 [Bacteroidales bacterium]|nr:hypothetical protein [Anaerotignum sp.]MCI5678686.1 hypothetical protein [Bacteroidales bacterium]MDY3925955.1 hypothetical protein [Anaerotignum sp.]